MFKLAAKILFKPYKDKIVKTTDYIELKTTQFNSIYHMKTFGVSTIMPTKATFI